MNRNFSVGILTVCFGLSSVNVSLASQVIDTAPIIVQPYNVQALNQQMTNLDRQNRDEESEIKELIEQNDKLTRSTLAQQQDDGLAKINQTMLSYRDALLSRDRTYAVANSQPWWTSRYGDLVALTEDADAMTVHRNLEDRSGMLAQKYQMLTQLKDEMTALNEKLANKQQDASDQKETVIDGFKKIAQQQQDKIQMLVARLDEMDKRISHVDEILAEKDHQIMQLKENLSLKDQTIKDQESQITLLQGQAKAVAAVAAPSSDKVALPPIIVNPSALADKDKTINDLENQIAVLQRQTKTVKTAAVPEASNDAIIKEKQAQLDLLKSELENKITQESHQGQKDEIIKQQQDQIADLKAQAQALSSKEELMKSQADQMTRLSEQSKDQGVAFDDLKAQVRALRNKIQEQDADLKNKNEAIRGLNEVVAISKKKAEYFRLTSQQERMSMQQFKDEVQNIKADFEQHFKDYDQFENAITSLKNQVGVLTAQLQAKTNQNQRQAQAQEDTKAQLQDKENEIVKMKGDLAAILKDRADKEVYHRHAAMVQFDDRIKLAKQLINLQEQEASLLEEKSNLEEAQNDIFDRRFTDFEKKIRALLDTRHFKTMDLQSRMQELQGELDQKQQQVNSLEGELKDKIANETNQGVLVEQIRDLKIQLQDKEDRIANMKTHIQAETSDETISLKQQLAAEQQRADSLKQQLDSKMSESDKMTAMVGDYQKKLESKDNAYNQQLQHMLFSKNDRVQMQKQINDLTAQLQDKEAEVVKIKKDMYDLQELANARDRDLQAKDLSLSMVQQKMMDDKINDYEAKINELHANTVKQAEEITTLRTDLAMAREELRGMPSSDEINFLRTGFQKATLQLKQKDEDLLKTKANADEYEKEFKDQTRDFQSLKVQLQNAYDELDRRSEDLKYKGLELIRLKERSTVTEGDLQQQVKALTKKLGMAGKKFQGSGTHENRVSVLQDQLADARDKIKELQKQLDQLELTSQSNAGQQKLKQALDKIDEQGRVITVLTQKLQEYGHGVDLSKHSNGQ